MLLVSSFILTSIIAGVIVRQTGRYWPFLVLSPCITAIGGGLLYIIDPFTSNSRLLGFQILLGIGIGFGFQNSSTTTQVSFSSLITTGLTIKSNSDVPTS